MRPFLLKILSISFALIGLTYGVDFFIEKGIKTSSYREISKWNEVIEGGIDADILIVGSSRALVHFDPRIIEEKTGMTCYNLGLDGSKYSSQEKVLDLYLAHNKKPKILIWSLDLGSFQPIEGIYRYEQFLPFWNEPEVKSILKLNKEQDQGYFNYPIIKYSNNPSLKYRGLLKQVGFNVSEPKLYQGYRESNKTWDGKFDEFVLKNVESFQEDFDERIFSNFKSELEQLHQSGTSIHLVIAPMYYKAKELIANSDYVINRFKALSREENYSFLDYSADSMSYYKNNFYNGNHLNKTGTEVFSNNFSEEINFQHLD